MVKKQPGMRATGRRITESAAECQLRETQFPYRAISEDENSPLGSQNMHLDSVFWPDPVRPAGPLQERLALDLGTIVLRKFAQTETWLELKMVWCHGSFLIKR